MQKVSKTPSPPRTGVILVNVGTPRSPEPRDVGAYLREFLMDPYVIDIPYPLRWGLVNVLVVPRRARASSLLYKRIWTSQGSPLLLHLMELAAKAQSLLGGKYLVVPAMRYGEPSIEMAVEILKQAGVSRIVGFPLYPQYSLAATKSSMEKTRKLLKKACPKIPVTFVPPFFSEPDYLDTVARISAPYLAEGPFDKVLFSFHGLPERQVRKTDLTGKHCLQTETCSKEIKEANAHCYRAQSFATAKAIARRLQLPEEKYEVCFQSRLGRTPWIRPYTDEFYRTLPKQGIRHLAVICPSFVADCLETLEEVQIRGEEEFQRSGGETLRLVPSLNSEDSWAKAVVALVQKQERHFTSPTVGSSKNETTRQKSTTTRPEEEQL